MYGKTNLFYAFTTGVAVTLAVMSYVADLFLYGLILTFVAISTLFDALNTKYIVYYAVEENEEDEDGE